MTTRAPLGRCAWLSDNFEPSGTITCGYLVYQTRPADVAQLCDSNGMCP